jgi:F-type H+-transporting ATPase subunit alpha
MSEAAIAVSLDAVDRGYLDDVEIPKVVSFEAALQTYMESDHKELMDRINDGGDWNDEVEAALTKALDGFKANHAW